MSSLWIGANLEARLTQRAAEKWESAHFLAVFKASAGFCFGAMSASRPLAANANRWVEKSKPKENNMRLLDRLLGKKAADTTPAKNDVNTEGGDKCPGCGLDLSKVLLSGTSSTFRCPACGTDITEHVAVLDLSKFTEEADSSEFASYANNQLGFSFEYPRGWNEDHSGGNLSIRPKDAFPAFCEGSMFWSPEIVMTVGEKTVETPLQFYNDFLTKQSTNYMGYELLWKHIQQLHSGEEVLEWSFKFKKIPRGFSTVSVLAVKRDRIYMLGGTCLDAQIAEFEPVFRQVVESLSLLKVKEKSEKHCPSCGNILPVDAIRCNKCGHRFLQ